MLQCSHFEWGNRPFPVLPAMLVPGFIFRQHYRVVRRIGFGGMGFVYEVHDARTARHLALKVLHPDLLEDEDSVRRFRQEATAIAAIESDHLVPVLDAGFDESLRLPYLTMELLRGCHLGDAIGALGRFPAKTALPIVQQLGRALDAVHRKSVVHRDLKPENLFLVRQSDGSLQLKVLDFGVAKLIAAKPQQTTLCLGTPAYIPPEQIRGVRTLDHRADLYALGQLAFSLLVGVPYFEVLCGKDVSYHHHLLRASAGCTVPASVAATEVQVSLPAGFDEWFAQTTHSDPAQRFDSAHQMVRALGKLDFKTSEHGDVNLLADFEERLVALVEKKKEESRTTGDRALPSVLPTSTGNKSHLRTKRRRERRIVAALALLSVLTWAKVTREGGFGTVELEQERTRAHLASQALPAEFPEEPEALSPNREERVQSAEMPNSNPHRARRAVATTEKKPACESPHYIDARGIKKFRRECLTAPTIRNDIAPPADCQVPFVIDERGIKRYRPRCLELALAHRTAETKTQ